MGTPTPLPPAVAAAINDVSSRFLLNLPQDEMPSVERLFFQVQQAHWFYEDFYVDDDALNIPHYSGRDFTRLLFEHCPLLVKYRTRHKELRAQFKDYLWRVPVYGCIMLDPTLTHALVVKAYRGNSWTFPKGKLNQGEAGIDCAAREAEEETGYNCRHLLNERARITHQDGDRQITLYIACGVPFDYPFAPITRKEISKVQFFDLSAIPLKSGTKGASRFWSCRPFMRPLLKYLQGRAIGHASGPFFVGKGHGSKPKPGGKAGKGKGKAKASGGGGGGWTHVPEPSPEDDETFGVGFGAGWGVEDMFAVNEGLLGVKFVYDGNSQQFGSAAAAAVPREAMPGPMGTPVLPAPGGGRDRRPVGRDTSETFGPDSGTSWDVEAMFAANEKLLGVRFVYDGNPQSFGSAHAQAQSVGPSTARTGAAVALGPPPPVFGTFTVDRKRMERLLDAALPETLTRGV